MTEFSDQWDKQQILEEFERRKKARQITVSIDDGSVRTQLRKLDQPVCLFGEGPADRRERLRQLLSRLSDDALKDAEQDKQVTEKTDKDNISSTANNTTWYHEGPVHLRDARIFIANYSIPNAKERIALAKDQLKLSESQRNAAKQDLYKRLRSFEIVASQIADTRPISYCCFSPNQKLVASSSWSGLCKLWTIENLQQLRTYRGHNCNACCIVFHPKSTISQSPSSLNMVSSGIDGLVNFWNLESDDPISQLNGHEPYRVSRVKFHPSGNYLATCCYDKSWRLFDLQTNEELLYQEGHGGPVYDIDFQCDGSLAVTGSLDSFARCWDLRTGRCIMFAESHLKGIISCVFAENGYQFATGSEDHTIKIWDLRQRKLEYTIPAHQNIVSSLKFERQANSSSYLVSGSYDNTIKLWAHGSWTPIQTLHGHDNKVMCVDLTTDNRHIISSSFDRTFKLWSNESP